MAVIPQCLSRIPCSSSLSAKVFHANSVWSGLQQFKLALQHSITTTHTSLRRSKGEGLGFRVSVLPVITELLLGLDNTLIAFTNVRFIF
jgi:hypothetical protein